MEPDVHDVCNLSGLRCITMYKMWQCANFKFLSENGPMAWEWGNFGSQKVRSVLNRAIFNRFASNLGCAHYFEVSPP